MSFLISFKQRFIALLLGLVCLVGFTLSAGSSMAAIALPLNPTLAAYQSDQLNYSPSNAEDQEDLNRSQTGIQGALNNVRDKLNLDQPIHPDTKEFFSDVKEKITNVGEDTQESVKHTTDRMAGDRR